MTCQEFSDQFDVLYNNVMSNQAPGLDEYEKSVFLTKAQDEILKAYFNPKSNKTMDGFDGNEKRQIDFSMVMVVKSYTPEGETILFKPGGQAKRCSIDSDMMMVVNEFVDVTRNKKTVRLSVIPIDYTELSRLSSKPYKRPNHYNAWRVIDNSGTGNAVEIQVGPNDTISSYTVRYIKRPYPIILEELSGVSINGQTLPLSKQENVFVYTKDSTPLYTKSTTGEGENAVDTYNEYRKALYTRETKKIEHACELDPILHEEILQRAVELAKAAYIGDIGSAVQMGSASSTAIGFVGGGGVPQQQGR